MTMQAPTRRAQKSLTAAEMQTLHLSPVELVPVPAHGQTIVPLAATLQLLGSAPGNPQGYADAENVVIGWLDQYIAGGQAVEHRPQWGRATLDALIRAGTDGPDGPAFGVLISPRFLWQPGVRPGKALALWLTQSLAPVPGDASLEAEVYYVAI